MRIATVMVTFNRLDLLKKTIETYEQQSILPEIMIIVDNCSTDGTKEYLDYWKRKDSIFEKIVIHLPSNIGGSGGFYTGLEYALTTDAEWYWIADDDAFLDSRVFEQMCKFVDVNPNLINQSSALCSAVWDTPENKSIITAHRRRINSRAQQSIITKEEYSKKYFELNLFTYVGVMMKAECVKKAGLPQKDFFIYNDDLEHSYRMNKVGKIYCIPDCVVYHNTTTREEEYGTTWRSYYQSRNSMFFLKWHFPAAYRKRMLKRYLQRAILKPIGKYRPKYEMDWDAAMDAKNDKLGISKKYFIGWKQKA